jgi:H+-translocating NAD(P) transhydrogenase subunit alpha
MKIGIPKETQDHETRVAVTPSVVPLLLRDGHQVFIQSGAGLQAYCSDEMYRQAGATVLPDAATLYQQAEVVFKVQPPGLMLTNGQLEAEMLREGTIYLGLLAPLANPDVMTIFAQRNITSFALDYVPRLSRAQGMDALTSMATVAGYQAVVVAAERLGKMFPLLMTAAGTVPPAGVLVLGAGVAGLQAIATARRLGARVAAFDPRNVVREQIQSLGADFVEMEVSGDMETTGGYAAEASRQFLEQEREAIRAQLPHTDVVICTAQVFGKPAPLLITEAMVQEMRPGSVIVDLAVEQGGNCALTRPDEEVRRYDVTIIGAGNLPATVPVDASRLYGHNVVNLFRYLYPATGTPLDSQDEILVATCLTRRGKIIHPELPAAVTERQAKGASV